MRIKTRLALLMFLAAAAIYTGAEAAASLHKEIEGLPHEIYETYAVHAASARYYLRPSHGRVAGYGGKKAREPEEITGIELKKPPQGRSGHAGGGAAGPGPGYPADPAGGPGIVRE